MKWIRFISLITLSLCLAQPSFAADPAGDETLNNDQSSGAIFDDSQDPLNMLLQDLLLKESSLDAQINDDTTVDTAPEINKTPDTTTPAINAPTSRDSIADKSPTISQPANAVPVIEPETTKLPESTQTEAANNVLSAPAALEPTDLTEVKQEQKPAVSLPLGGETSIDETYDDWKVSCGLTEDKKAQCVLTQRLLQKESGQQVLMVVLVPEQDRLTGNLVLPFGLDLISGVQLQVDQQKQMIIPYKTCIAAGCIVQLNFNKIMTEQLQIGKKIDLLITISDNNQQAILSVSLSGFANAMLRVNSLLGNTK